MSTSSSSRLFMGAMVSGVCLASIGCGSKWQMHNDAPVPNQQMFTNAAPEWVRRGPGCAEGLDPTRLYFVGRSHNPDLARLLDDPDRHHEHMGRRTSADRIGYTVLDERDAVQSARNDVYDQIRQRLSPRNYGLTAQTASMMVDSGQCVDCETAVPLLRTSVQQPCNEMCARDGMNDCGGPSCTGTATVGGTMPGTLIQASARNGCCGSCGGEQTLVSNVVCLNRRPDYLPVDAGGIARDLNLMNVGIDSVMPAMLAALEEEEVYFEKWNVREGNDFFEDPFAEGNDEWQSYKAWILFSIPREEFGMLASEFRVRYEGLLDRAMALAEADRARRIEWENKTMELQLQWQLQEREWNREDETIARDHAIGLDFDRIHMPGRRYTVVGSSD